MWGRDTFERQIFTLEGTGARNLFVFRPAPAEETKKNVENYRPRGSSSLQIDDPLCRKFVLGTDLSTFGVTSVSCKQNQLAD